MPGPADAIPHPPAPPLRRRWTMLAVVALLLAAFSAHAADPGPMSDLVLVGDESAGITTLRFDAERGTLSKVGTAEGGTCPSYLAWNHDATVVYAVNEWDPQGGCVRAFRFTAATGGMTPLGKAACGGTGPCFACVHPGGRWLLVANYGSGDVGVLPIHADGTLGDAVQSVHPGAHAHMALVNADGTSVLVPCLGADHIAQYRFDPATGTLSDAGLAPLATAAGAGPRFLAQVESSVYCVDELSSEIMACSASPDGRLARQSAPISLRPAGSTGASSGAHVAISPDGGLVIASVRGLDRMAVFRRDRPSGALTALASTPVGAQVRTPRSFAFAPDGRYVLIAGQGNGTLAVYRLDHGSGALSAVSQIAVSAHPTFVGVLSR